MKIEAIRERLNQDKINFEKDKELFSKLKESIILVLQQDIFNELGFATIIDNNNELESVSCLDHNFTFTHSFDQLHRGSNQSSVTIFVHEPLSPDKVTKESQFKIKPISTRYFDHRGNVRDKQDAEVISLWAIGVGEYIHSITTWLVYDIGNYFYEQ